MGSILDIYEQNMMMVLNQWFLMREQTEYVWIGLYTQVNRNSYSINSLAAYGHLPANFVRHFSTTDFES